MSRLTPTTRKDYPLLRPLQTRWEDVDIYGHVNNVVYLSYFDTAINSWYIDNGILDPGRSVKIFVVAETGAQYFSEIKFPDPVHCGIRVMRLGSSSVTYDVALFTNESDVACARGRYIHVLVDEASRQPVPIDGPARTNLEALLAKETP